MLKKEKFFLYILIFILVITLFSIYIYITSPTRIIQPDLTNIINTKSNKYIKSICSSDESYSSEKIYNFLVSLKGQKLNFENESDNEGSGNFYVYGLKLNNNTLGVGIINKGNFLIPKWKITKVFLW